MWGGLYEHTVYILTPFCLVALANSVNVAIAVGNDARGVLTPESTALRNGIVVIAAMSFDIRVVTIARLSYVIGVVITIS